MSALILSEDAFGQLRLAPAGGGEPLAVTPVRAFPLAAPDDGIALIGADGHECAWIDRLADLSDASRALVERALAQREFVPEITRIRSVSSFATPTTWDVSTTRGDTRFILKSEDDIRRLADGGLLIADTHGIQFRIRQTSSLDATSRRLLDRFL